LNGCSIVGTVSKIGLIEVHEMDGDDYQAWTESCGRIASFCMGFNVPNREPFIT
jgi:hypothetical protein